MADFFDNFRGLMTPSLLGMGCTILVLTLLEVMGQRSISVKLPRLFLRNLVVAVGGGILWVFLGFDVMYPLDELWPTFWWLGGGKAADFDYIDPAAYGLSMTGWDLVYDYFLQAQMASMALLLFVIPIASRMRTGPWLLSGFAFLFLTWTLAGRVIWGGAAHDLFPLFMGYHDGVMMLGIAGAGSLGILFGLGPIQASRENTERIRMSLWCVLGIWLLSVVPIGFTLLSAQISGETMLLPSFGTISLFYLAGMAGGLLGGGFLWLRKKGTWTLVPAGLAMGTIVSESILRGTAAALDFSPPHPLAFIFGVGGVLLWFVLLHRGYVDRIGSVSLYGIAGIAGTVRFMDDFSTQPITVLVLLAWAFLPWWVVGQVMKILHRKGRLNLLQEPITAVS